MKQISYAGIGVTVLTWWGKDDFTDKNVKLILDKANKYNVKICFHIEPFKGRNAETTKKAIEYLIDKYGSQPAFYRNGKNKLPLFFVYDSYLTKKEEWKNILSVNERTQ